MRYIGGKSNLLRNIGSMIEKSAENVQSAIDKVTNNETTVDGSEVNSENDIDVGDIVTYKLSDEILVTETRELFQVKSPLHAFIAFLASEYSSK